MSTPEPNATPARPRSWATELDRVLVLLAFMAALTAYVVLALKGDPTPRLEDILFVLAGTLAGISLPRSSQP